ncbi:hypothetical protein A2U01_0118338, partial [Trifolium medium]|nr:hypothetical protein [Trifolium medium]
WLEDDTCADVADDVVVFNLWFSGGGAWLFRRHIRWSGGNSGKERGSGRC